MKRYPKFHSILLFIVALFCFLLSEVYFLSNPMFYKSDFIDLYHGPIILYLLWLSATVGLSRIDHGCARGLLLTLAFIVCTVMIGVNAWLLIAEYSIQSMYLFYNKSLWFSLSLLFASAFTTALVLRSNTKARPRRCCALLFVLAACCVLLGGLSFVTSPDFGLDYPCWYLGQLLLYAFAVAATIALHRIEHTCTKGLLIALACIAAVAGIGAIVWISSENAEIMAKVYPNDLLLWLSLPLLNYAVFAGVLACRKRKRIPSSPTPSVMEKGNTA